MSCTVTWQLSALEHDELKLLCNANLTSPYKPQHSSKFPKTVCGPLRTDGADFSLLHTLLLTSVSTAAMDHIALPAVQVYPPVCVPCLSDNSYDGLDFHSYPDRRGWDQERLLAGDFSQRSSTETAAFLQDWLFFGVLWHILGCSASKDNYVESDRQEPYGRVTTALLDDHLNCRLEEVDQAIRMNANSARSYFQHAESCLKTLSVYCRRASSGVDGHVIWPVPPAVDLSLRALGKHLCSAIYSAFFQHLRGSVLPHLRFPGAGAHLPFPEC